MSDHTDEQQQEITEALAVLRRGAPEAMDQLLPLVYADLRRIAHRQLAAEATGHTLCTTALVHEAYLRLVQPAVGDQGPGVGEGEPNSRRLTFKPTHSAPGFDSLGHFFAAAAEAMRRILIEKARRRARLKRGDTRTRASL